MKTLRFIARWLGNIVVRVEMTVLYFTIVAPFGVVVRLWLDPLTFRRKLAGSFWYARSDPAPTLKEAVRQ